MSSYKIVWPAVSATVFPHLGALAGGLIMRNNTKPWDEPLKRPEWGPPRWAFGPIWTSLYCGMGFASYLVWRDGRGFQRAAYPLSMYAVNIALNWTWIPIRFWSHNLKWSFYHILAMWASAAVTGLAFYKVNATAGYLFIPYLAWNTVAAMLSYAIYRDNPNPAIKDKKQQ